MATGLQLPVDLQTPDGQRPTGFGTPQQDRAAQVAHFAPRRVLPIVFLPGIMGSNLRISSSQRMRQLGRGKPESNMAWRPDAISAKNVSKHASVSPEERQLTLDPNTTAVDVYNPHSKTPALDGDERHGNVVLAPGSRSPFLMDDPPGQPGGLTAEQKARQRGWGEVFFKSYGRFLQHLESRLNNMWAEGRMHPLWADVVGVDPKWWKADPRLPQQILTADELRDVANGCWFPVHAIGYNWLQSNDLSAKNVAERIEKIIESYSSAKAGSGQARFECTQVILITHSMGGLVGRAVIHPDFGGIEGKVLGVVHGVQPAVGAAAAYKRMRAGFEDPGLITLNKNQAEASVAAKISGNCGDEVTAVLANSPGGLQLLPSQAYGEGWLQIKHNGHVLARLPIKNSVTGKVDPYEDIYMLRGKWYGLIADEQWINPAGYSRKNGGGDFQRTVEHLTVAREFHAEIEDVYHPCTYVHFGEDQERLSFGGVLWEMDSKRFDTSGWKSWRLLINDKQGGLELEPVDASIKRVGVTTLPSIKVKILPPDEAGDQTVPVRSAEHQIKSGRCKGAFRQEGYEHQNSYKDSRAIASTLYSIVRIAQQSKWGSGI